MTTACNRRQHLLQQAMAAVTMSNEFERICGQSYRHVYYNSLLAMSFSWLVMRPLGQRRSPGEGNIAAGARRPIGRGPGRGGGGWGLEFAGVAAGRGGGDTRQGVRR